MDEEERRCKDEQVKPEVEQHRNTSAPEHSTIGDQGCREEQDTNQHAIVLKVHVVDEQQARVGEGERASGECVACVGRRSRCGDARHAG